MPNLVTPDDVGKRVSFQFELPNGFVSEAVGTFERWDEAAETYFVRKKDGSEVRVPVRGVLFGKVGITRSAAQADVVLLYRTRTGAHRPTVLHAWELDATLRRSFGRFGVRLNAEFAPREFELGPSLFVEAGPTYRLARRTFLFANVGRRERSGAPEYTALNFGISHAVGKSVQLDARYYTTDRSDLGHRYRGRLVFSARLSL